MQVSALLLTVSVSLVLIGCIPSERAGIKVMNGTENEARLQAVSVNGKNLLKESILIPARSAQKYSAEGHVPGTGVAGRETLALTLESQGSTTTAQCRFAPQPEGVCLAMAIYDGSAKLVCWFDCDASSH